MLKGLGNFNMFLQHSLVPTRMVFTAYRHYCAVKCQPASLVVCFHMDELRWNFNVTSCTWMKRLAGTRGTTFSCDRCRVRCRYCVCEMNLWSCGCDKDCLSCVTLCLSSFLPCIRSSLHVVVVCCQFIVELTAETPGCVVQVFSANLLKLYHCTVSDTCFRISRL